VRGRFQYISKAANKITGYTAEELKGRHFTELVVPEMKKEVGLYYVNQLKGNNKESNYEFQILTPDGQRKWVEQNVVILYESEVVRGFQGIVRDITTRKEVEIQLAQANTLIEETRKTLQSILDNTTSIIFIKDLEYRYMMVNKQFEKVFKVSFEDVYKKNDYDFRNEKDAVILQKHDWEIFNKLKPLDYEYTFDIQGENRTFLITKFPLYDDAGNMYGLCGVYTEITAQKKVEQLLRERDERFTKIFQSSPAAMVLATINPNKVMEANESFVRLTGYKPKDILGKNSTEIGMFDAKERDMLMKIFEEKGHIRNQEARFRDKYGNYRYCLTSTEVITIEGVKYALSLYYDITERKQYEKELANARTLLIEAMGIGRMGTFENNVGEQTITWSKEVYDIMEMPYNDKPLSYDEYIKAIHPDDTNMVLEKIENTLMSKQPDVIVNRFIIKKGNTKWIETRVVPMLNEKSEITLFRGTMQDITELKETEQQLRQAKELAEQSVIAKEQFLANMSHEIRTPMNGVLGFTELLSKTDLNKEQNGFVRAIETSGKNLMAIINDILDYSKIEAGMMTIDETPLSIHGIFSSLAVLFSERARQKTLKLVFKADDKIPHEVLGDPVRLTQIITNLVNNSIKFTEKGSVNITAKQLEQTKDHVKVLFQVKDSGIGIPKEKLASVFERFNQGSNDTSRKYGGTGLGLSIVKKLTELQGGTISVESTPKKGSTFSVIISYKIAAPSPASGIEKGSRVGGSKKISGLSILLVEDNILNQKLAERVLLGFNFSVDIAANGKIAVGKIKKKQYDLVLMDMQMPEMNGYEATAVIREELHNNIPIIAMTAHAMGSEKEKCLALGMNDYISKPFKADDLYSKIAKIYKQHKATAGSKKKGPAAKKKGVVNLSYLIKITDGNKEFIKEMLQLVVTEMPPDLTEINTAIAGRDFATIKAIAHKLKSTIPIVGLDRELPALAEVEQLAANGEQLPRIKKLFAGVEAQCRQAVEEIVSNKDIAEF